MLVETETVFLLYHYLPSLHLIVVGSIIRKAFINNQKGLQIQERGFNSLPNKTFLDCSKLKAFADEKIYVT